MFKDGLMRDIGSKRDGRIIKAATEFRIGMIGDKESAGYCGMICWPLATMLAMEFAMDFQTTSREDIELDDGSTTNHIWIVMPDGRVLDPTMDQFGAEHPPVYLGQPVKGIHTP